MGEPEPLGAEVGVVGGPAVRLRPGQLQRLRRRAGHDDRDVVRGVRPLRAPQVVVEAVVAGEAALVDGPERPHHVDGLGDRPGVPGP